VHQFRRHGTIDATTNGANDSAFRSTDISNASYLFPNEFFLHAKISDEPVNNQSMAGMYHSPIRSTLANIDHKTPNNLFTQRCMCDFGVKLDPVEWFGVVRNRRKGRRLRGTDGVKIRWNG
jgi:hypothetical protein